MTNRVGLTAIEFLDSERLGVEFRSDVLVSDYYGGRIYRFDLDRTRTELLLNEPLRDKVVDDLSEIHQQILGKGFDAITNMEVGPDGYMYILSNFEGTGNCDPLILAVPRVPFSSKKGVLFRVVPNNA